MRLKTWLDQAAGQLNAIGISSSLIEAQILAAEALNVERSWIIAHYLDDINPLDLNELLAKRLQNVPVAYITGKRDFYGRTFQVNPSVLIPRHETEILVEATLEYTRNRSSVNILEYGVGSGCVAITLKIEKPELSVTGLDISEDAIETAKLNANSFNVDVHFILSDGFTQLPTDLKYDFIISNPPYIKENAILMPEVIDHEPHVALFGGKDGLNFYQKLALDSRKYLNENSYLICEIGDGQLEQVQRVFENQNWQTKKIYKDLNGIDRVLVLERS